MEPSKEYDPWDFPEETKEKEGYSVDQFYTGLDLKRGAGKNLRHKTSEAMAREISKLIQSRQIPQYETQSDFSRDAEFHRMMYLKTVRGLDCLDEDTLATEMAYHKALQSMDRLTKKAQAYRHFEDAITKAKDARDWAEVRTIAQDLLEAAGRLSEPYSSKFLMLARVAMAGLPAESRDVGE